MPIHVLRCNVCDVGALSGRNTILPEIAGSVGWFVMRIMPFCKTRIAFRLFNALIGKALRLLYSIRIIQREFRIP